MNWKVKSANFYFTIKNRYSTHGFFYTYFPNLIKLAELPTAAVVLVGIMRSFLFIDSLSSTVVGNLVPECVEVEGVVG